MGDALEPSTTPPAQSGTDLEILTFTLGPFGTNCYVVIAPEPGADGTRACWVVDASFEPGAIIEAVRRRGLRVEAVVLTHTHVDHIAGVEEVLRASPGAGLWVHADEAAWLSEPMLNLSGAYGFDVTTREPTRTLKEGDELRLGSAAFTVLHTPGHSPGGITLHHAASRTAIVGDALFAGGVGRTDFPGSDEAQLLRSIREKLYTLPESTKVLPGHGPATTVGREKKSNPVVRSA